MAEAEWYNVDRMRLDAIEARTDADKNWQQVGKAYFGQSIPAPLNTSACLHSLKLHKPALLHSNRSGICSCAVVIRGV